MRRCRIWTRYGTPGRAAPTLHTRWSESTRSASDRTANVAGRYGYAGSGQVDAPGQRKLVVDVATNTVCRTISPANAVRPKSFIDDVRVNGKHAYLANAGAPALLMLDLSTSQPRRRFLGGRPGRERIVRSREGRWKKRTWLSRAAVRCIRQYRTARNPSRQVWAEVIGIAASASIKSTPSQSPPVVTPVQQVDGAAAPTHSLGGARRACVQYRLTGPLSRERNPAVIKLA